MYTERWIRFECLEFHNTVEQEAFEKEQVIRLSPPDGCFFEVLSKEGNNSMLNFLIMKLDRLKTWVIIRIQILNPDLRVKPMSKHRNILDIKGIS